MERVIRRMGRSTTIIGIFCWAVALNGCEKKQEKAASPPAEVVAITVTPQTVPVTTPFVAQVTSSHQVDIVARVSGFLDKILYKEGDVVKAGQVMFTMDQKPFQAQVDAAKGEVEQREAQLWTAQANLARIEPLAAKNAASKSDRDNAIGSVKSASASLYEAKARLEKAQLDLTYTTITSPVTGASGKALLREGAYLSAMGQAAKLTYVAVLNPIWVEFSVSQNEMATTRQEVAKGQLVTPRNLDYNVEVELSDGNIYPYQGKLSFADPSFSQQTGTFMVRAELANPKAVLRPGMFVKVYVKGAVRPNAIVVPQKAVQQTDNGHVVTVINDKGQAEPRPIIVGDWVGDQWVIRQGLKGGEKVVVSGFQRLAPGAPVKVISPEEAAAKEAAGAAKPETTPKPAPPAAK